ncbi:MAG: MBL fold metallo-hydrolase [Chloroflexota bacterium]
MQRIIPGVYRLRGLTLGNVYLIDEPAGMTLIDASIEQSGAKILKQIASLGRPLTDLKRILITHGHPDHVGALPEVQRATGAEVYASSIERPVIEGRVPIPRTPPEKLTGLARLLAPSETFVPGTPVHRELQDGEVLPEVLGGLTVVATPGHAPGHVAFWHPDRRLLFCGDVIFHVLGLRLPPTFFSVDMDENRRSVARLAQLEPAVVCFGHGQPLTEDAAAKIRRFAESVALSPAAAAER